MDTPVRGFVYEAGGAVEPAVLERGAQIVRAASETWRIRVEVVSADPALHDAWLGAMKEAVEGRCLRLPRNARLSRHGQRWPPRMPTIATAIVTSASRIAMATIEFQTTAAAI